MNNVLWASWNRSRYEEIYWHLEGTNPKFKVLSLTEKDENILRLFESEVKTLLRADTQPPFCLLKKKYDGGNRTHVC